MKSKISQADFVSAYRVLSAASGRECCHVRTLCAAVGLSAPSVLRRMRLSELPSNPRAIGWHYRPQTFKTGRSLDVQAAWSSPREPLPVCPRNLAAQPTRLAVLRTYRAIEACTGKRPKQSRVAAAIGISRERVRQIEAELVR